MPVIPSFMERLMLLRLNKGPGPMLELLGAWAFKAVSVGVKLGVFERLRIGALTAADLALQIGTDERGCALLLQALEALGYVVKSGERYRNTPMTEKWMLGQSPTSMAGLFTYFEDVLERWKHMEETVRRGAPPVSAWEWFDKHAGGWDLYQGGMAAMANMSGDEIVARIRVPKAARRLLDVGGGHGWYSVRFCRRYPELSATIFDWPQGAEAARRTIAAAKMPGRVDVRSGNYWTDDLDKGYQVALLFNIVHMYPPDKNRELLGKVAGALDAGGIVAIMDQMAVKASGAVARAMAALAGMELLNAVNGQTYAPAEVGGWLRETGFADPRPIFLRSVPGFALVVGTKGS